MKLADLFEAAELKAVKYQWQDGENTLTLVVSSGGKVRLKNQHNTPLALSTVGFNIDSANGDSAQREAVKQAAVKGLAELRRVTQLPWKQV